MGKKKRTRQKYQQPPDDNSDDSYPTKTNEAEVGRCQKEQVSERTHEFFLKNENDRVKNKRIIKERVHLQEKSKNQTNRRKISNKVKGLSNLGNTCFFNAVLQNLIHTPWLYDWLKERSSKDFTWKINATRACAHDISENVENCQLSSTKEKEEPLIVTLSPCKPLTQAFLSFLQHVNSTNDNVLSPGLLFGKICTKSPQFKGHQQQDSHELLCHLFNLMKIEEGERQKHSILKLFNLTRKEDVSKLDEATKKRIKDLSPYAYHTFVDAIFGGQLLSTVTCEECGNSSQIFEPFINLSLPVSEEKPPRPSQRRQAVTESNSSGDDKSENQKEGRKLSKHQETKMKRKQRKLAKKQEKAEERKKKLILLKESEQQEESEGDQTEADVEDNIEVEVSRGEAGEKVSSNTTNELLSPVKEINTVVNIMESDSDTDGIGMSMEYFSRLTFTDEMSLEQHVELMYESEKLCEIRFCSEEMRESKDSLLEEDHDKQQYLEVCSSTNSSPNKENIRNTCTDSGISNGESDQASICGQHSTRKISQRTLGPRYHPSSHECSVLSSLNQFTATELLTGNNKFGCENCTKKRHEGAGKSPEEKPKTVYTNASKQLLIFSPPAVLILHLKRFQQNGRSLRKVNRHVDFPLVLDIAPFCSADTRGLPLLESGQKKILYSLYGVVEHIGQLTGGHYTAFVKERDNMPSSRSYLKQEPIDFTKLNFSTNDMSDNTEQTDNTLVEPPNGRWYYVNDSRVSVSSEESVLHSQGYLLFYERIH